MVENKRNLKQLSNFDSDIFQPSKMKKSLIWFPHCTAKVPFAFIAVPKYQISRSAIFKVPQLIKKSKLYPKIFQDLPRF